MDVQQDEPQNHSTAALTIVVHSWATPIVGVLMLVIGLLGGYFGRQLLLPQPSPGVASSPAEAVASSQDQPANPDELMAFVVGQTRHFKGDPNAPVTLIEFSDFQ